MVNLLAPDVLYAVSAARKGAWIEAGNAGALWQRIPPQEWVGSGSGGVLKGKQAHRISVIEFEA
jgi:hypothetical protein